MTKEDLALIKIMEQRSTEATAEDWIEHDVFWNMVLNQ